MKTKSKSSEQTLAVLPQQKTMSGVSEKIWSGRGEDDLQDGWMAHPTILCVVSWKLSLQKQPCFSDHLIYKQLQTHVKQRSQKSFIQEQ